ncbi:MAG: hypothetical protein GC159_16210 [Phycisphaera sp.]|nr:hypothetical protein [Phycisphaera sp.]
MGLDIVEVIQKVESRFDVQFTSKELEIYTVAEFCELTTMKLVEKGVTADDALKDEVFEGIRQIICDQRSLQPDDVRPESHLIYDLGLE